MFYEKTINSKEIYKGRIIDLRVEDVELTNGTKSVREIITHGGASAILANHKGKVILVRQFRKPIDKVLLEMPAGKIDPGEDPTVCALRELEEETGMKATHITKIGEIHTTPGFSNELIHIYYTENLVEGKLNRDEDEMMDTVMVGLDELEGMIENGDITDGKTLAAIAMCRKYLFK
ncbi:NUDIX hydrolase [Alkalibacter saccharofermentans]|uniref:ADP-ribose pyrophosphatase n=1 Tax=Alkalibacter saccharofermentans DSM 14828 TaxID=1120975 RepID=A0A1M4UHQ1_9FIRM|nr:NUDIX hydrolase [Alkalibacter saccharofermentans]SHE56312.1 ADP-ribose pyrophosphatase [Alkalibacter saccharofermentans DSM 14828]